MKLSLATIRADVEALAAMTRDSAGPGERDSAAWVAERLREAGASEVAIEPFRYQSSYAGAHALHAAAGIAAAGIGGLAGAVLAGAALQSLELEVSGRNQWLRRLLPAGEGANVVARIPAAGERRATLVLVAHHDAAQTGIVWHPHVVQAGAARHMARRRVDAFQAPVAAAFGLVAAGSLVGERRAARMARRLGVGVLALSIAAELDVARSPTVPGASDNATGVATVIALASALAAAPLEGVEVRVLCTGCEESGMGGMLAWAQRHAADLDRESTLVLGLDTLGAGTPIVCSGEGSLREHRYRDEDLLWVDAGAARAGLPNPERWRIGGWTDPIVALHAGLPSISLLSMGPGYFPHYHHPTDLPEHVDWDSVERCARIAAGAMEAYSSRATA